MSTAIYNASANPSRRVKVARMPERTLLPRPRQTDTHSAPSIEPFSPASACANNDSDTQGEPAPISTDKRGRKSASKSASGGFSRSARETQRKLNHSIIEKARRTKINDALAELARLSNQVELLDTGDHSQEAPAMKSKPHMHQRPSGHALEGEDDEDVDVDDDDNDDKDGDYIVPLASSSRTRSGKSKSSTPISGKDSNSNISKGKDKFKLDILVKTVENMRTLLGKVEKLEAELREAQARSEQNSRDEECSKCIERELLEVKEREPDVEASAMKTNKRKRSAFAEAPLSKDESLTELSDDQIQPRDQRRRKVVHHSSGPEPDNEKIRPSLPSISSWLPDYNSSTSHSTHSSPASINITPTPSLGGIGSLPILSGGSSSKASSPLVLPYLPSPPSSTRFPASVPASGVGMPVLELGPSSVPVPVPVSSESVKPTPSSASISTAPSTDAAPVSGRDLLTTLTSSRPTSMTINTNTAVTSTPRILRTPEEESAASLLLHMRTSPPVFTTARVRARKDSGVDRMEPLRVPPSILGSMSSSASAPGLITKELREEARAVDLHYIPGSNEGGTDNVRDSSSINVIAQTPSSILGLG